MTVNPMLSFVLSANTGEVITSQTVWEFLASGGFVMVPLGLCSVVLVAFAMERYARLTRRAVLPARVDEALDRLETGHAEEAMAIAEDTRAPAARILMAGMRRRGFAIADVERAMEDQAHKELVRLRGNIKPISIVANIAPLLGLFGTVVGIAEAFHRVVKTGMGKPEHLASGIELALTTTIVGLAIAVPAMVIAAHLGARADRLLLRIDEKLSPWVERLAGNAGASHAA
jgi:biopolymer transport protein ExbB